MKEVKVYTDGACSGNPGPGGWGAILFYEDNTSNRYPGAYILLNSKFYQSYLLSLNSLKNIITKYNNITIKLESISLDFEDGLINAVAQI